MGASGFLFLFVFGLVAALATACKQGERHGQVGWCATYLECDGTRLIRKSCSFGKIFDSERKECDWPWKAKCESESPDCQPGDVFPDPDSCRMYLKCVGRRITRKACPLLHVFDPAKGDCSFGIICPTKECSHSEKRAVSGDCSAYEICQNGSWIRESCGSDTMYNPLKSICDAGGCTQCSHGELAKGTAGNRYQECELGLWTEKECPEFHSFDSTKKKCVLSFENNSQKTLMTLAAETCKDGDTRAEDNCSKYSICSGGKWEPSTCPKNYLFDSILIQCMLSEEARCLSCPGDQADPETCSAYYVCDKGVKIKKTCGFLKQWDGVSKKCVFRGANCFPGAKCTENGKKLPTNDCKFYEECISGNYYKKACGFSKVYDAASSECVWAYPWASCKQTTYIAAKCKDGESKPLDCTNYAKCINGQWTQLKCDSGETFVQSVCVKAECVVQKLTCASYRINGIDLKCPEGEIFDENAKKCITGTCKVKRDVPECQDGEVQSVEDNCQQYKVCVDGKFVLRACSDCMNFDPEAKTCRYVYSSPCTRVAKTTLAPVTTTEPQTPSAETTTRIPATTTLSPATEPQTPSQEPTTLTPTINPDPSTPSQTTEQPAPTPGPTITDAPTTVPPVECTTNQKKPNKQNCKKFYVCKNGKFVEDSCNLWRKFDSIDLKCVNWGARCAS